MQTDPEKTSPEEFNIVEKGKSEDSEQEKPTIEQIHIETTDVGRTADIEIPSGEQAQLEQTQQDSINSENDSAEQNNIEGPQIPESDLSSDHEDAVQNPDAADEPVEETAVMTETSGKFDPDKIFEAIQKMTQSPAAPPQESIAEKKVTPGIAGNLFQIRAEDIMQSQVTWASPDDSLQQVLAKMQQTDAGYIMVGQNGLLEGIISKSDITKAMSPYLQPIFTKWRRPLDDATLKIRVKWIMSRPVRRIKPETPLVAIMEYMNQFRGWCLAVTDEQDKVHGLVTAFDIFQTLLKNKSNTYAEGRQTKTLVESAAATGTT